MRPPVYRPPTNIPQLARRLRMSRNAWRTSCVPGAITGESATAEARQLLGASSPDPDGVIWHTIGTRSVLIRLVLLRMAEPAHYPQSITSLLAAIALYDHDITTHGHVRP